MNDLQNNNFNFPQEVTNTSSTQKKRLVRSNTDFLIFGVCGGIANYFGIRSNFLRSFFIVTSLIGGWGIAAYLFSLIFLKGNPPKRTGEKNSTRDFNFKFSAGFSLLVVGFLYTFEQAGVITYSKFLGFSRDFFLPVIIISAGLFILFKYQPIYKAHDNVSSILQRSSNKRILGVCGGFAEYFNVEPVIIRMLWLIFSLVTLGIGTVIYFLFYLFMPESKSEVQ